MSFIGNIILWVTRSHRTASMHTVTTLTGISVKNISYLHREYPVYHIGDQQLVSIEALRGGEQNFEAAAHFQRQAKDLNRKLAAPKH